jgi:hypothetical protein
MHGNCSDRRQTKPGWPVDFLAQGIRLVFTPWPGVVGGQARLYSARFRAVNEGLDDYVPRLEQVVQLLA